MKKEVAKKDKSWFRGHYIICGALIFLAVLLFVLLFYIYGNNDNPPIAASNKNNSIENFGVDLMRFNHTVITYSIDLFEGNYLDKEHVSEYFTPNYTYTVFTRGRETKINDIRFAFSILENVTDGVVTFKEVSNAEPADILVKGITPSELDFIIKNSSDYNASEYNQSSDGVLGLAITNNISNMLTNATIYFAPITSNYLDEADWPYGRCITNNGAFPRLRFMKYCTLSDSSII